jgi:transposase-like protein
MQTALIILGITVLVVAVDIAYEKCLALLKKTRAHGLLSDSLAPFSEKLSSSKLLVRLKMLTKEWCPYCSSPYMRRSHRYFFEKPLSIFGLWPYRCLRCKARFQKTLGRHFDNASSPTRPETDA